MSNTTAVVTLDAPELEAVEPSKAEQIRQTFVPMADMLAEFEDDYTAITTQAKDEVTPELSAKARRLRLDIAKVRIEAEKLRKALKQEYLLAGRAIDGTNNVLKWAISQKEEALEAIEKHAERMEAERLEQLQADRVEALAPYVEDADERDLSGMDDDVWAAYLAAKKQEHADRIEAEKRAEAERIERERIDKLDRERTRECAPFHDFLPEHDGLGEMDDDAYTAMLEAAKAAKAEHEAEQERVRKEAERLAKEKKAAEKAAAAERKKAEAALAEERKRREAAEEAERKRVEAEAKAEKERKKAAAEAAKAPTKNRLAAWVESFALPELPGDDHETAEEIRERFADFCDWANEQVEAI